jgi:phosphoribosylamine--glycine ligase
MKILVVGSGAREHALAWRLARDGHAVLAAPGNPGIARVAALRPVAAQDTDALVALARSEAVDLVVVGPEAPLAAGLADALSASGVRVFGPTQAAARIESSKAFAKEIMAEAKIPTASARVVSTVEEAMAAVRALSFPVVLKADGLAAGKGVLVAEDSDEAHAFAASCLESARFGHAGARLVVEEFLAGEEASLFFLSDGLRVRRFLAARDYKRLHDGDRGPNTGGMGAYAPAPLDAATARAVEEKVALPALEAMTARGTPFRGLLYAGLMLTASGPRVLEFNARFGDPETQVLLPLVAGDLGELLDECARGALASPLEFEPGSAVGVVLAAPGYPEAPKDGAPIGGLDVWPDPTREDDDGCWCFHAGTRRDENGQTVAAGGRVLTVVARASDRDAARRRAYAGLDRLSLAGGQARRDVAASVTAASHAPTRAE